MTRPHKFTAKVTGMSNLGIPWTESSGGSTRAIAVERAVRFLVERHFSNTYTFDLHVVVIGPNT